MSVLADALATVVVGSMLGALLALVWLGPMMDRLNGKPTSNVRLARVVVTGVVVVYVVFTVIFPLMRVF